MKTPDVLQCEFVRMEMPAVRELVLKLRRKQENKFFKNKLDGSLNLVQFCLSQKCRYTMPNAHSPDKEPLSLQIPRPLMGRLKLKARQMDMTLPNYIIAILTNETHDITLSSKDYEAIARATAEAERTGRRCATRFDRAA